MHVEHIYLNEGLSESVLTTYIQDLPDYENIRNRPAVLILPGGAYISITEKEAEPVALKFLAAGYQAFVLKYSIGTGMAQFPLPIFEVAKSILLIRENAKRWGIDANDITICAFSTGAHLAGLYAASWQDSKIINELNVESKLLMPNAVVLGYPVLDLHRFQLKHSHDDSGMKPILEMMFASIFGTIQPTQQQLEEWDVIKRINKHFPPTFLWTTLENALIDVEDSLNFTKALEEQHVPFEFHIFQKGIHGLSLGDQTVGFSDDSIKPFKNATKWFDLAITWLENLK